MICGGELVLEYFVSSTRWDDKMLRPYKTIRNNLQYKARVMNTFRMLLWFVMVRQWLVLIMPFIPSALALMQPCYYTPEHPWKIMGKYIPETPLKFYTQDSSSNWAVGDTFLTSRRGSVYLRPSPSYWQNAGKSAFFTNCSDKLTPAFDLPFSGSLSVTNNICRRLTVQQSQQRV